MLTRNWGRFRDLEKATQINQEFLVDIIRTRREEFSAGAVPKSDILSLMIQSAENEGKFSMTDAELVSRVVNPLSQALKAAGQIGNTAILLFAGHGASRSAIYCAGPALNCMQTPRH